SPGAFGDGLAGPFDEGLAQELWGVPAPVDPELMAALYLDRRNASELLHAGGLRAAAVGCGEGHEDTRGCGGTGSRQPPMQIGFGMGFEGFGDMLLDKGN